MPSLCDLMTEIRRLSEESGFGLPEEMIRKIEKRICTSYPGERIYVPSPSSKDAQDRAAAMRKAAKTMPTRVVAERFGVSHSYVRKLVRVSRSNTPN